MYQSLEVLAAAMRDRVRQIRESGEAGVSMEQVVITAGLLALAIALVAAITAAVNGRMSGIF